MKDVINEIVEQIIDWQPDDTKSVSFELICNTIADYDQDIFNEIEERLKNKGIKILE